MMIETTIITFNNFTNDLTILLIETQSKEQVELIIQIISSALFGILTSLIIPHIFLKLREKKTMLFVCGLSSVQAIFPFLLQLDNLHLVFQ
jgi:hypothetical protein